MTAQAAPKPSPKPSPKPAELAASLVDRLRAKSSASFRADMARRYGIIGPTAGAAFGVRMADTQAIAKSFLKPAPKPTPNLRHAVALALWTHSGPGTYEARMLACLIDDPALVTAAQMDRRCRDFDNWAITDTVCFKLLGQVAPDLILRKVDRWTAAKPEFQRRAGFALLACAALHNDDVTDDDLLARLPLIESSTDDRNFVKKAVSWALRAIAMRRSLRPACRKLAQSLATSTNPAQRWTGKDALKALK